MTYTNLWAASFWAPSTKCNLANDVGTDQSRSRMAHAHFWWLCGHLLT